MHLDIRIQRLSEAEKGGVFPELSGRPLKEIKLMGAAILEGGTGSGQPAVMFHGFDGETVVLFQLTAAMLDMVNGATKGADQRWKENPEP